MQTDRYRLTMNSWGKIVKDRKYWENEMEKKFELDSELDMLLDEQLIREAELLEKELFADKNKELYTETEEETNASYERLVARLKADGVYRNEAENETSVDETEASKNIHSVQRSFGRGKRISARRNTLTDEQKRSRRRRISAKIAGVIVVSGMCVFTATMTSEANRKYWLHNMRILTGQDTRVVTDNDERNEVANADEYTAMAEIEEKLGIEVPEFHYRPEQFIFSSYQVDSIAGIAWLEYAYEGNIIMFHMDKSEEESTSYITSIIGEEIQTVKMQYEDTNVNIGQIKDADDELLECYAKWKRKNVNYFLYGRIEVDELTKTIKKIVY